MAPDLLSDTASTTDTIDDTASVDEKHQVASCFLFLFYLFSCFFVFILNPLFVNCAFRRDVERC